MDGAPLGVGVAVRVAAVIFKVDPHLLLAVVILVIRLPQPAAQMPHQNVGLQRLPQGGVVLGGDQAIIISEAGLRVLQIQQGRIQMELHTADEGIGGG